MDASKRDCIKSTSLGVIMRDNQSNVTTINSKSLKDCSILVDEYSVIREAIIMAIQNGFFADYHSEWLPIGS